MAFKQLTYDQRCQIFALNRRGFSCRAIAADIGVHHTTISRELRRNARKARCNPTTAHHYYHERRYRRVPIMTGRFVQVVLGTTVSKMVADTNLGLARLEQNGLHQSRDDLSLYPRAPIFEAAFTASG